MFHLWSWVYPAVITSVQFALFLRWLYRRIRDDDINRAFIRNVATNHLPHIYDALKELARVNGIELGEPPPVQWIDPKALDNGNGGLHLWPRKRT